MHTKFQLSMLTNKKVEPSAPRKGRFVALREVNPRICISLYFIPYGQYAYQISALYFDKQKMGALAPRKGRFVAHRGVSPQICNNAYHCKQFWTNNMRTKFQLSIMLKEIEMKGPLIG